MKDAASASLYGAKGANGVVLITTKKGKEGKLRVNMAAKYGITDFAYTYRPLMGGEERRKLIHEGLVNFQLDKGVRGTAVCGCEYRPVCQTLASRIFGLGECFI